MDRQFLLLPPSFRFPPQARGTEFWGFRVPVRPNAQQVWFPLRSRGNLTEGVNPLSFVQCASAIQIHCLVRR
ncbi:hypothetical protein DCOP10_118140 [Armatimonadetes bacterium DC]|nr:hypothetical protein DCOP10_118140 [Armatimonadetes bacterium DC]